MARPISAVSEDWRLDSAALARVVSAESAELAALSVVVRLAAVANVAEMNASLKVFPARAVAMASLIAAFTCSIVTAVAISDSSVVTRDARLFTLDESASTQTCVEPSWKQAVLPAGTAM